MPDTKIKVPPSKINFLLSPIPIKTDKRKAKAAIAQALNPSKIPKTAEKNKGDLFSILISPTIGNTISFLSSSTSSKEEPFMKALIDTSVEFFLNPIKYFSPTNIIGT